MHAMELYAKAFDDAGALERLEGFASVYGPAFYGLAQNAGTITLLRQPWTVPAELAAGATTVVPLDAGMILDWALALPAERGNP